MRLGTAPSPRHNRSLHVKPSAKLRRTPRILGADIKLFVRPSRIDGRGLFAAANLPARRKLGELSGALVRLPHARTRVAASQRIYLVELSRRYALDCSAGNVFKHLNHSCQPNCYLRVFRKRVEVYTLRHIRAGTELTVDYGLTPHRNGMKCQCGAARCRGMI